MTISHTLQLIAGKDPCFLDRATISERTMWTALGILTSIITILVLLSVSQGLFLVYFPDGFHYTNRDWLNMSFIALFSLAWAMIIFNFYRFILSISYTYKTHSFDSKLPIFFINLFFGLLIGLSISLPLAVITDHQELKENSSTLQEKLSNDIIDAIEIKNKDELSKLYVELTLNLHKQEAVTSRLKVLQKTPSVPAAELNVIKVEFEGAQALVNTTKENINVLRQQINSEKNRVESMIKSNDGLMTNINKTLEKNKLMLILISIFVCSVVLVPTQIELFFTAGLYEYLIEYNNHVKLAGRGIAIETNRIFVDRQIHYQPKYLYPEEMLRQNKIDLNTNLRDDIKKI